MSIQTTEPTKVVSGLAVSGTNTYTLPSDTSRAFTQTGSDVQHLLDVGFIFRFTGTMTGIMTVEVSNATIQEVKYGTDLWVTYTQLTGTVGGTTVTNGQIAVSGAVSDGIELKQLPFGRVRLRYVNATNSGTIDVWALAKGR